MTREFMRQAKEKRLAVAQRRAEGQSRAGRGSESQRSGGLKQKVAAEHRA